MNSWVRWCLLSFAFVLPGCRSTPKLSHDVSSELSTSELDTAELATSDAAIAQFDPNTFVNNPELQAGAGTIDANAALEFLATDSGLKYRILRRSDGEKPTAASTVTVHYRGWLSSGRVFDSSYERGETTTFPLQNVIAGWTEGMQLVGEGGMIELQVPSRLGYGERGSPGSIPPHSNLRFIVELVSVN